MRYQGKYTRTRQHRNLASASENHCRGGRHMVQNILLEWLRKPFLISSSTRQQYLDPILSHHYGRPFRSIKDSTACERIFARDKRPWKEKFHEVPGVFVYFCHFTIRTGCNFFNKVFVWLEPISTNQSVPLALFTVTYWLLSLTGNRAPKKLSHEQVRFDQVAYLEEATNL